MINYAPFPLRISFDWNVKIEPVYRVLDNTKWMENFFETGELMLSCFNKFRNYPNEMQGDKNEGEGIVGGVDDKGNHNYIIYESGLNAFIMSNTTELTKEVINDFNGKCAIKIHNPTLFALEISKKLPFVNSGLEGKCTYVRSRVHTLEKEKAENRAFQNIDFQNDYDKNERFSEITLGNELFLKLEKYKHQNEYRLIWFSDSKLNDSIFIKCPEAIRFCEKIIW